MIFAVRMRYIPDTVIRLARKAAKKVKSKSKRPFIVMAPPYPKISTILRMNPVTSTSKCSASMGPKRIPSVTGLIYLNILKGIYQR